LDLPDLGLVLHAELPQNKEVLLHRSGRTGRAGRKGLCVLLAPQNARRYAERLLEAAHIKPIWAPAPSAAEIRKLDQQRLVRDIAELAREPLEEDLEAGRALLAERSPEEIAAALVRSQRAALPAPEELEAIAPHRPVKTWPGRKVSKSGPPKPFKSREAGAAFRGAKKRSEIKAPKKRPPRGPKR
jgi:ATP-dependent RNA helicase DeaD